MIYPYYFVVYQAVSRWRVIPITECEVTSSSSIVYPSGKCRFFKYIEGDIYNCFYLIQDFPHGKQAGTYNLPIHLYDALQLDC